MMTDRLSFAGVIPAGLIVMFLCCCGLSAQEQRTWSDATGKFKIEAKLQRVEDDKVFLEKEDGNVSSIPLEKLSKKDREYIASQKENPFDEEGETSPFASEKVVAGNGSKRASDTVGRGFGIKPKRLNGSGKFLTEADNHTWNCPPDEDTTPLFKGKPAKVNFDINETFGGRTEYQIYPYFADGKHYALAAVQIEASRNPGFSSSSRNKNNAPDSNETRFIFCNLETGKAISESVPDKITLLDVSPDGTTALFRGGAWSFSDFGTKNVLYVADISSQKVKVLSAYAPFDDDRVGIPVWDIKNAFMLTKDIAAVMHNDLIAFNVKTGRVVWIMERVKGTPVFSANKKYCIVNGSIFEASKGKSIGKFDVEDNVIGRAFSFSPDGKYAAFTTSDTITFFDAQTGKAAEPFYIGINAGKHVWTGNQFILAGSHLVDSKTNSLVWEYSPAEFYSGGYTWCMSSAGHRNNAAIVPVKLPHPAVGTSKPEWAVAAGKEVALKIDGSISDRKSEIAAYLEKVLKDNGVKIKDDAPITVEASIRTEKESSVFYSGRPGMRAGGTEIKYIPEVFSVQVKQGDKIYWQTSMTKAPPSNISLEEINKSSIQEIVSREMAKINYADWFLKVKIPKQIPGGDIGRSMITMTGIIDIPTKTVAGPNRSSSPPAGTPEEKAVRECFNSYKQAVLNNRGSEACECLDSNTIKHYDKLLQHTKTANKKELEKLSLTNRMTVLVTRAKASKEEITQINTGEGLLIYAVDKGMIGKDSVSNIDIGTITVNGDFATSKIITLNNKQEAPFKYQFRKENGKWKWDMAASFPFVDTVFKEVVKRSGMTETEFIFQILENLTGKKPDVSIWNPL